MSPDLVDRWGAPYCDGAVMGDTEVSVLQVMVADDEPKLRALVAGCARSIGASVVEAKDGDEAWQLAQSNALDVVVLDVMMPGMSGWEVCRRIKSAAKTSRGVAPKVLMLTGIGEHLNEMTSPLFAADDWIDKPFELEQLRAKIAELGQASLTEVAVPIAPVSGPSVVKVRSTSEPPADELADEPKATKKKATKKKATKKKAAKKKATKKKATKKKATKRKATKKKAARRK